MSDRRTVSPVDTMWLNMDHPDNLMVIDSVMWFADPVDWDRLAAVVQRRMVDRYPVFRQRPVSSLAGLGHQQWEDDPGFALDRHLHRVRLPRPGDDAALRRFVEARMCEPLDRSRPLWDFHLVDGYRGGSAVVTRFHHAIADGMALAEVLLSLTDATATADLRPVTARSAAAGLARTPGNPLVRSTLDLLSLAPALLRPRTALAAVTLSLQTAHVADKLLLRSNPPTALSGRPGSAKRAVWSEPRPLSQVKRAGLMAGATVNDVLMGAVSGSISSYLQQHGEEPTDLTTMVPVNLRPPGQPLPLELGNRFALVLLPLPSASHAPLTRLAEVKRRMDAIKTSPEAAITFGLINAIGQTHPLVERLFVDFFAGKAIGVTTNVIGPRRHRFVAGSRIEGVLGWVPGHGSQTVGVCIFSYDRTVRVGFKVDAGVVHDPELLVEAFDAELDDLLRLARAG